MKTLSNLALALWLTGAPSLILAAAPEHDPIIFSFATVGDSRADPEAEDMTGQDRRWLQNSRALARILREIQAQKPDALFFNGDMIYGYSTNRHALDREYAYWRGMVAGLLESGTYVVPVPGNHECQIKVNAADGTVHKTAWGPSETAWRENMGDLILDTARWKRLRGADVEAWDVGHTPPVGGPDRIESDQRQLSYSFDYHGLHFTVINTDPTGNDAHAPVAWLKDDLAKARQRGARHCFVFGHKQAFTYGYSPGIPPKGLDVHPQDQQAFWDVIEANAAAYFCGHEHIYHASQPRGRAWQIIAGSGGSPFEAKPGQSAKPHDRYYVWAWVRVHHSGRVQLEAHGFDEHFHPTKLVEQLELAPAAARK